MRQSPTVRRICVLVLLLCSQVLHAQRGPSSRAALIWAVDVERGGPTAKPGALAVGPSGAVAFTRGSEAGDHLVTLLDSTSRIVTHFVRKGSGPGEFQSVFALFFSGGRIFVYGPPQVSAFDARGTHLFSRAVPPVSFAMALYGDSVDLLDLSGLRTPGFLGEIRRKSLALNGGDRVLIEANNPAYRALAQHPTDSGRFLRVAYGVFRGAPLVANPFTYRIQRFDAAGRAGVGLGTDAPLLRLTGTALQREIEEQLAQASRPFKLPDGSTRPMPDRSEAIRRAAAAPRAYFSDRLGGFHVDEASGDIVVVETATATARVVRYRGSSRNVAEIPCDARGSNAAVNGPFVALVCSKGDEDGIELRLYRIR